MAKATASVFVNRPVAEVFEFVTDFQNGKMWQKGFVEWEQTSEGEFGVGTSFKDVREFLGRKFQSTGEIIEYDPSNKFGLTVTFGPVPFTGHFDFEPVEEATRINFVAEGEPGWFFKLLEPLVVYAFQKQMEENFAKLREVLESPFWKPLGRA